VPAGAGIPTQVLGGTTFRYGGANTGYFGLAITAGAHEHITLEQLDALTTDIAIIFRAAGWSPDDVDDRIVGHDSRAIFNPRDNPKEPQLWGKLGRKIDPTGFNRATRSSTWGSCARACARTSMT
jgi:hypothetical protein